MTRIWFWILFLIFLAVPGTPAVAGECRALLRPLLLQAELDNMRLRAVRELCADEAEVGDPDALYQSALFHLGLLEWSPDAAIPMIRAAAVQGVPEAQYWLAWQYDEGPLLPNDRGVALRWYEAAGEGEHRLALQRLATAYRHGELGVVPDMRKAAMLRARAALSESGIGVRHPILPIAMRDDIDDDSTGTGLAALQRFCVQVVRFMSTVATDPHLYFEQQLTSEIAAAESLEDVTRIMAGLVDWVGSIGLTTVQIERLDGELGAVALPTFSLMRVARNRNFGRILASGEIGNAAESLLLRQHIATGHDLPAVDAELAARLVAGHDARD